MRLLFAGLLLACAGGCRTTPESAAAVFEHEVGTWAGHRLDVASSSRAPMRMRVERSGDGYVRFLEVGETSDAYRGATSQTFDARSQTWVRSYANSTRRAFGRYRATEVSRDRSVWRSISPRRTRESRLVSEHVSNGTWRRTMSVSEDGTAWTELWIDKLTKLPASR